MISRVFLAFNALTIGAIGVAYLFDPNLLLARYDLETGGAGMDNMLRATYGGLYLMCAVVFTLGVVLARRRRDSLAFLALFMFGAAFGRIVSIASAGAPPSTIMPLLYFEIVAAIIAVILFIRSPQSS